MIRSHPQLSKLAAAALMLCIYGLTLAGCGASGSKEFSESGYPFSFDYPGTWTLTRSANTNVGATGTGLHSVAVALEEPFNQATIADYKIKKTLPAGVNGNKTEVDRIVKALTRDARGSASDGKAVKYGGIPGYQYTLKYAGGEGVSLSNKLTFLFRGQDEFQINCQSTSDHTNEMNDGCDEILKSLKFS